MGDIIKIEMNLNTYNQHVLIKLIVFDLERVGKGIDEQGVIPIDMMSAFDKNSNLSTLSLKC